MRDAHYGLMCVLMLGIGQMCLFIGYCTQSFIVDSVLKSVAEREPIAIDSNAGFYGEFAAMITCTIASLAAPYAMVLLGTKLTLVIGSSCFTLYMLSFMRVHFVPFYLAATLMGIGFIGYFGYLTEHSTRNTIESNTAVAWAVRSASQIVGGVALCLTVKHQIPLDVSRPPNQTAKVNQSSHIDFREYSNSEIRFLYGAYAVVCFTSSIIFAVIPGRFVLNCLADASEWRDHRVRFADHMVHMGRALTDTRILQMAPLFCLVGMTTFFTFSIYPTTLIFTVNLSKNVYLPACYLIVVGIGNVIMGILIMAVSKGLPYFGQIPSLFIGTVLIITARILALLSTPISSTISYNDDPTLLIEPSVGMTLLIAFLFGMADNCINTSRAVLCALSSPDQNAQIFAIAKFFEAMTACILMVIAQWMSLYSHFVLIALTCTIVVVLFGKVIYSSQ